MKWTASGSPATRSPMIRPWYRSRLFWLGVPGLVFLLWLWWDSMHFSTAISVAWEGEPDGSVFGPPIHGLSISEECGRLGLAENVDPFFPVVGNLGIGFEVSRVTLEEWLQDPFSPASTRRDYVFGDWFPAPVSSRGEDPFRSDGPGIAIWLLVVLYGTSWGVACVCWQRRKRHRLTLANRP